MREQVGQEGKTIRQKALKEDGGRRFNSTPHG